jgi:hypothetical protein
MLVHQELIIKLLELLVQVCVDHAYLVIIVNRLPQLFLNFAAMAHTVHREQLDLLLVELVLIVRQSLSKKQYVPKVGTVLDHPSTSASALMVLTAQQDLVNKFHAPVVCSEQAILITTILNQDAGLVEEDYTLKLV